MAAALYLAVWPGAVLMAGASTAIRGAPRDALLSAIAPKGKRGVAFGVHEALDKSGAIVGPLLAYAFLRRRSPSLAAFHTLFAGALVPAFLSVLVLAVFVPERSAPAKPRTPLREALRSFGPGYRHNLVSAGIFSAAYFSFAFLLLAAFRAGFAMKDVALLYALFNATFTVVSAPVGYLSDRIGRRRIIATSYILYAVTALGFAFAHSKAGVAALFGVYGIFYAIDEGQTKRLRAPGAVGAEQPRIRCTRKVQARGGRDGIPARRRTAGPGPSSGHLA